MGILGRVGRFVKRAVKAAARAVVPGAVDVTAVDDAGRILLIDAKKESRRVNPGRKNLSRIHRARTAAQKRLGARIAYVDIESRDVQIVPPVN